MVRTVFSLLAALLAGTANAAPRDWASAGGSIFAGPATADEPASNEGLPPAIDRLPPLTQPFGADIETAASRHGLDPKLLHALVVVESAYKPNAISTAGAGGLTQLMPATARSLGVEDRFGVAANLAGGARFLAQQLIRFGDLRLSLAAYNAGPERVARLGRVPNYPETKLYVERVVSCYLTLAASRPVRSAADCKATTS